MEKSRNLKMFVLGSILCYDEGIEKTAIMRNKSGVKNKSKIALFVVSFTLFVVGTFFSLKSIQLDKFIQLVNGEEILQEIEEVAEKVIEESVKEGGVEPKVEVTEEKTGEEISESIQEVDGGKLKDEGNDIEQPSVERITEEVAVTEVTDLKGKELEEGKMKSPTLELGMSPTVPDVESNKSDIILENLSPVPMGGNDPTLIIEKTIINNDGGTATVDDFAIRLNGELLTFGPPVNLSVGKLYRSYPSVVTGVPYTLTEIDHPGYVEGFWYCEDSMEEVQVPIPMPLTFLEGQEIVCRITNNDRNGQELANLKIITNVVDLLGLGVKATDFKITVSQYEQSLLEFWGSEIGTDMILDPGNYDLFVEDESYNYQVVTVFSPECPRPYESHWGLVNLEPGENKVCTITNYVFPKAFVYGYKMLLNSENVLHTNWVNTDIPNDIFSVLLKNESGGSDILLNFPVFEGSDPADIAIDYKAQNFQAIAPGTYRVNEVQKDGYISKGCTMACKGRLEFDFPPSTTVITIDDGNWECKVECTNQVVENSQLEVTKSNDSPATGVEVGSDVMYTIRLKAPVNNEDGNYIVKNVVTFDRLPKGFLYKSGSWKAISTKRGELNILEPIYGGEDWAKWDVGDMVEGEEVTLTYITKVSSGVTPGVYPDSAWASGGSVLGARVLGNVSTGSSSEFVETEVKVLGLSGHLPSTGSDTFLTIFSVVITAIGVILLSYNFKKGCGAYSVLNISSKQRNSTYIPREN